MSGLTGFLTAHGTVLLLGSSILLVLGALAVTLARSPIRRLRFGELTMLVFLVWAVCAVIPMPRLQLDFAAEDVTAGNVESTLPSGDRYTMVEEPRSPRDAEMLRHELDSLIAAERSVDDAHQGLVSNEPTREVPSPALGNRTPSPDSNEPLGTAPPMNPAMTDWPDVLAGAFVTGAGLSAVFLLLSALVLFRILRRARAAPTPVVTLATRLAAPRSVSGVRILVTQHRIRPFCVHLGRPTVVLPERLCDAARGEQLKHVLLHELSHLEQRDGRGQLLFALALPLLYWHPVYWWLKSRVRLSAEMLADDHAAAQSEKKSYAQQLIDLAENEVGRWAQPLGTHTLFRSRSEFYRRIEMLMKRDHRLVRRQSRTSRTLQWGVAAATIVVTVMFLGVPQLDAQSAGPTRDQQIQRLEQERDALRRAITELQERIRRLDPESASAAEAPSESDPGATRRRGARRPSGVAGAPSAMNPAGATPGRRYLQVTVKPGDSLHKIASRYYRGPGGVERILEANPGIDPERLQPGLKLNLPGVPRRPSGVGWTAGSEPAAPGDTEMAPPGVRAGGARRARGPGLGGASGVPAQTAPPMAPASSSSGTVMSPSMLDLVTLAIDLQGEVELASLELQKLESLPGEVRTQGEVRSARIRLETTERKRRVVHELIEAEMETTQAEIDSLRRRIQKTPDAEDLQIRVMRLDRRLQILGFAK